MMRPKNYPIALPHYLIAHDGVRTLIHGDSHPGHEGDIHNHGDRSRGHENSHSIHNYAPRKGVGAEDTPTMSGQPEVESQGEPVSYSYHYSLPFVFICLDGVRATLFKLVSSADHP